MAINRNEISIISIIMSKIININGVAANNGVYQSSIIMISMAA
jgi:hypothetical protein